MIYEHNLIKIYDLLIKYYDKEFFKYYLNLFNWQKIFFK